MSYTALLDVLASAELEFARFNARRTCTSTEAEISLCHSDHFSWLRDSSRPRSAYYNRAIARHVGRLPPAALAELPNSVSAVELRPLETRADTTEALLAAGFHPTSALCYLATQPASGRLAAELPVKRLTAADADDFLDLLARAGTPFGQERRASKRHYYCTDTFQVFVVEQAAGSPLGWSTMFVSGSFAFLGNSYTLPECRGRGVHSALLAARLNAAGEADIEHVFTDVEHGSQSHANCERAGLRTVTINTVWERRA